MKFEELLGKTISYIKKRKALGYDDFGFLDIGFTDNTNVTIHGTYAGFSGKSHDEYAEQIKLEKFGFDYEVEE